MEKITRNNVEAWMLDYQEGNLSDVRINELLTFLKSHPELPIDPDFSDFLTLEAPVLTYPGKSDLFRTDLNLPELSEDEIDCIARIEGDMIPAEEEAFDSSLGANLEKAVLFQSLKQTILKPDTSIVYGEKDSLRKRGIQIPLYVYSLVSAAAIIIFGWFIFSPNEVIQEPQLIAKDTSRQIIYLNKLINPSKFDKIAMAEPVKILLAPDAKPIIEPIVDHDFALLSISPAEKLPVRLLISSSPIDDKSYAFIHRAPPYQEDYEYQTLLAYTGSVLRERILGQDADFVKKTKFSFWELADVGIDKVSNALALPVDLNRQYNDNGKLESIAFDSRLVAFSTPINRRRSK